MFFNKCVCVCVCVCVYVCVRERERERERESKKLLSLSPKSTHCGKEAEYIDVGKVMSK